MLKMGGLPFATNDLILSLTRAALAGRNQKGHGMRGLAVEAARLGWLKSDWHGFMAVTKGQDFKK
jgi:hypothetical protein